MNSLRTPGRGASGNLTGRFEQLQRQIDLSNYGWIDEADQSSLKTEFFNDSSRSILARNNSPDIPFEFSINPYRGCEHGCAYCYARPTHEYFGLSAGLDFESKIFVKQNAPQLLREQLLSKRWRPKCIAMSGVTDCYQPAERSFQLTRQCLQVFSEFRNPVSIITKNALILRDIEILSELASDNCVVVFVSVTSLDGDLARELEPRTSSPAARLRAIEELNKVGVPVGVNVAPVIPGLTDHEMPGILEAARAAGARFAGYTPVRLPFSVREIFTDWLKQRRPLQSKKVLSAIREIRGGELNDASFGSRMRGAGVRADGLADMFEVFVKRLGFDQKRIELSIEKFRRPEAQLSLF